MRRDRDTSLKTGMLIRGIGGFYDAVLDDGGEIRCRLRGRLRRRDLRPLTGDRVRIRVDKSGSGGVIEDILPRRSQLQRPPIANVEQACIVLACAEPEPDRFFLDRLLTAVLAAGLRALLCLNKADLVTPEVARAWVEPYRAVVAETFIVSAHRGWGLDRVMEAFRGRITTLAGPSGVGKSALLNALYPGFQRETGEVSHRLGRGRHTTRAVELLALPTGGWIADTPGFSQIDLSNVALESVQNYFPDLAEFTPECRFSGCLHLEEPDCAVREAAESGRVAPWRYRHYRLITEELREEQARQYR